MADPLHKVFTEVRDLYTQSLKESISTLFATLESRVRDALPTAPTHASSADLSAVMDQFVTKKELQGFQNQLTSKLDSLLGQIRTLSKPEPLPNPLVHIPLSPFVKTPIRVEKEEVVEEEEEEEEVATTATESVDCEGETKMTPLEVDGTTYWLDNDCLVYKETDEGYEQIGIYDADTGELNLEDEEEEEEEDDEEEDEEAVETEEFIYKGRTWYRDSDGAVYNEEGEEVGVWTGTKIVFQA